jgi:hypothetical protein
MGYNIHDVLGKDVAYSTRKKLIIILFVMISNFETTPNLQGMWTHAEIHID